MKDQTQNFLCFLPLLRLKQCIHADHTTPSKTAAIISLSSINFTENKIVLLEVGIKFYALCRCSQS
jgi:hypothetical protein